MSQMEAQDTQCGRRDSEKTIAGFRFTPTAICDGPDAIPCKLLVGIDTTLKVISAPEATVNTDGRLTMGKHYVFEGLNGDGFAPNLCRIKVYGRNTKPYVVGHEFLELVRANGADGHVPRPIAIGTLAGPCGTYRAIVMEHMRLAGPNERGLHSLSDIWSLHRMLVGGLPGLEPNAGQCATFALQLVRAV